MKKLVLASVVALLPVIASADGLLGSTVDVRYHYDDGVLVLNTLDSVLVAAGTEFSCPGGAQLCQALTAPGGRETDPKTWLSRVA